MQKYVAYVQMYENFWICSICCLIFAYAILKVPCGKICNMQVLAKCAIAYLHITSIASQLSNGSVI